MPLSQMFTDIVAALTTENVWALMLAAYLVGAIPFGFLVARRFGGQDVREQGSGNIGATNVARVAGARLGVITLVLDALKGAVFVLVGRALFSGAEHAGIIELSAGCASFLGHCFSIWLRFRGGKGVATAAAVFVTHRPLFGLIGVAAFALIYASFRRVSLSAIIGGLIMVPTYFILGPVDGTMPVLIFMLAVMVGRHHENIGRLLRREELAFHADASADTDADPERGDAPDQAG